MNNNTILFCFVETDR